MNKRTKGFTLLEMTVALTVWLVLSGGVFFLWQHAAMITANVVERQNSFENARATMDVLVMNIQLSYNITLDTNDGILRQLTLSSRNPQGVMHDYVFDFDINLSPTAAWFQVLRFGENEFSSGIARIYMAYVPGCRIEIAVHTACEGIVLRTAADVRYKNVSRPNR